MEKTITLIKKLLAHADSARSIGSLEEAMAFTEKANALLLEHKLGMTDLEIETENEDDPIDGELFNVAKASGGKIPITGRRTPWITYLGISISRAHFCEILTMPKSKTVMIVGRDSDRAIVKYLFTTLTAAAYRMGIAYEKKVRYELGGVGVPPKLANDFRVGFVMAIDERLTEMRRETEVKGGQFAITRFHNADQAVKDYVRDEELSKGETTSKISAVNSNAIQAGLDAGRKATLHGGVGAGNPTSGTLARGQRLLGGGK